MKKKISIYCAVAIAFVSLEFAKIFAFSPFGAGLLIALSLCGMNVFVVSALFLASTLIEFSWLNLIGGAAAAIIALICRLFPQKLKKSGCVIASLCAPLGYIAYVIAIKGPVAASVIAYLFTPIFTYLAYSFLSPVFVRKLRFKFLDSELVAGGILLVVFSMGLSAIEVGFPIVAVFFAAITLTVGFTVGGLCGLGTGICFGIGYSAALSVPTMLGCFAFMSLLSVIFLPAPRVLSAFSIPLGLIMYVYYFSIDLNLPLFLAALLCGGLIYALLPHKMLEFVREFFGKKGAKRAMRALINADRAAVGDSLLEVRSVFVEMSAVMGQERAIDGQIEKITGELLKNVCSKCKNYDDCGRCGVVCSLIKVIESALEKGSVALSDLPDSVKEKCTNLSGILAYSNSAGEMYESHRRKIDSENAAKKVLGAQMRGMAELLSDIAARAQPLTSRADNEMRLCEELTYRGIITLEAVITGDGYPMRAMMCCLTSAFDKQVVVSTLRKLFKCEFMIEIEPSTISGYSLVTASARPRFDVVFAAGGCSKEKDKVSGDTHAFLKLSPHKFLMAVCDGMGSGEKAERFSETALSLIESLYKAGFEHNLVLSTVNNFLTLSGEEIYAAVDVAVIDLESGMCDLIKIGSPQSYIKTADSVGVIEGSCLPIGVLEEMRPSIKSFVLSGGETLVLVSDGVSDSFNGDGLANCINNAVKFPEGLASSVIEGALINTARRPIDDLTVAACHIFEI